MREGEPEGQARRPAERPALGSLACRVRCWAWTTLLPFLYLPVLVLPRQAIVVAGRAWAQTVLWLLARMVGLRHRIEGLENVPAGPAIWALKHQSAWETFALIRKADGSESLRSLANNMYVTAENAGANPLIANRAPIGPEPTSSRPRRGPSPSTATRACR